jgi:uncharacterized protein (DUF885 family)
MEMQQIMEMLVEMKAKADADQQDLKERMDANTKRMEEKIDTTRKAMQDATVMPVGGPRKRCRD